MSDNNAFVTRRNLLKMFSGGFTGGSLLPHLSAQQKQAHSAAPVRGLHTDDPPVKIWDVPSPQAFSGGTGDSVVINGQIAYASATFAGKMILQDLQTGATTFQSPTYLAVGNARAIGSQLYFITSRLLQGSPITRYDPATQSLTTIYNTNNVGLLGSSGRFLYFIENKQGVDYMACWDTVAGRLLFSTNAGNSVDAGSPAVESGDVIVYGFIDRLMAVDPTGKNLWTFHHPENDNNVLYSLAAADGNVYFTTGNTLYAVDLTSGKLAWQWTGNSPLGDPVTYNGVVLVGDVGGNFNAIQGTAGGTVAPGKAAWPALPFGSNLAGPIFVEDGIAYTASNVLIAIELNPAEPKIVTYAMNAPVSELNGVENGVVYFAYANNSRVAAVDMGHQIHEFFCDSHLMADDYVASSQASGYQPASPRYRTHVRLLDPSSNPRVDKSVKVWASDTITITSGGYSSTVGPNKPVWLQTDTAGEIEIISAASDISTPALYLWGTFMDPQEAIVIYPDHRSLTTLSSVQGSDLAAAKTFDGTDMLADKSGTGDLASTITNTLGGVAQSLDQTRRRNVVSLPIRSAQRLKGASPTESYIAFPESTPNMLYQAKAGNTDRVYVRNSVPNWTTVINVDGTISFQPTAALISLTATATLDFAAFVQNVAKGAHKIARIVVNTTDAVYHAITDELGQIYHFVVDTVEKAIAVVSSVLKTIVKDIVKAVEWLSWLFNWTDILDTKNQIKSALTTNAGKLKSWLQTQQGDFALLHTRVQTLATSNGTDAASKATAGRTIQSVQVQDNDPQATYGASGAQAYTPSKSLQSRITQNSGQGTVTSSTMLMAGGPDNIVSAAQLFIQTVESRLAGDFKTLGGDLAKVIGNFKLLIADPGEFVKHGVAELIQLMKDVAKTLLDFVDAIVESFIGGLAQIIDDILALANTTIHIPVISDLWQLISRSPLTVLDLCALLAAVPVTIIEKAIRGEKVSALPGAAPPLNKNIGFAFLGSFSLVFDGLNDLMDFSDTGIEAYLIFGLSLLTQGLNFPDDEIGNPDGNQILLYAVSWFPVAVSAFLFASARTNVPLKNKVSKQAPMINFMYGAVQLVMASWIGVLDRDYAGKDNLGMIAGILGSVPFLAKIAATGEAMSPQRVAVSTIDGVFEATSLGLTVASW